LAVIAVLLSASLCFGADNAVVAARLARKAEQARNSGRLVRAYLLYAEAAVRDPKQPKYAVNRDALAPLAHLLSTSNVEQANVADDVKAAEDENNEPPLNPLSDVTESTPGQQLEGPPHLALSSTLQSFDLRVDARAAIAQVAQAYGIQTVFDPEFDSQPIGRFQMTNTDFRTAMEALTSITHTFVFPLTPHSIFVARDTELKRAEYEPTVLISVPIPDAVDRKDVIEAANAVRGVLRLRAVAWDDSNQTVIIRDHVTAARAAAALLQSVVLPRAQVSFEVQIIAVDSNRSLHYGVALPTTFPAFSFAHLGNLQSVFPDVSSATGGIFAFTAAHAFFGVALGNATVIATYTKSISTVLYKATVVVEDGQTATLHVGDKYPIPSTIYTGASTSSNAGIYNPIGEVTNEDLGIKLKLSPHVNGVGDVGLDLEAEYENLAGVSFNTIPAVAQRTFKGSVRLNPDEFAIIAGLADDEHTVTRSGLPGLAQIPWIDQLLAENQRTDNSSNTLVLIRPTITRLPMGIGVSPQFLLGSQRGARVLM
jgi:general secretion pathway protein D